jgi:hypothetical protein
MNTFRVLIAIGGNRGNTTWVQLNADNAYAAHSLAESMYGAGNVITYTQV